MRAALVSILIAASVLGQGSRFQVLNQQIPQWPDGTLIGPAADFDLDGDNDILTGQRILVNDGNARFSLGPPFPSNVQSPAFWNPGHAGVGDVNGDGFPDVVVATGYGNGVFLNDGALGLVTGPPTPVIQFYTGGISLADVDSDGDLDAFLPALAGFFSGFPTGIIYALPSQPQLWLNDGSGTFTDATAARVPAMTPIVDQVDVRDYDGDGDPDVLLVNGSTLTQLSPPSPANLQLLLLNSGSGYFAPPIPVSGPAGPAGRVVGDFNGDQFPDIAYSSTGVGPITIGAVLNAGGGTFTPFAPTASVGPNIMLAADLAGNGSASLITIGPQLAVRSVSPTGAINPPSQSFPVTPYTGVARDLDGDGDVDVMISTTPRAELFLNDGTGVLFPIVGHFFGPQFDAPSVPLTPALALGDVEGDGDVDCVYAVFGYPTGSRFVVARNDGHGTFVYDPSACGGACPSWMGLNDRIFPLDFDADGDLDLYAAGTMDTLFQNNGSNWIPVMTSSPGSYTSAVIDGDVDGDGDRDLVVGRCTGTNGSMPGTSVVMKNQGGGVFIQSSTLPGLHRVSDFALFDADGDQDLDLVQADSDINCFSCPATSVLFLNDGTGIFTPTTAPLPASGSISVTVGDIDADGDVDLVIDRTFVGAPGDTIIMRNGGTGVFTFTGGWPSARLVTDLFDADGDGDLDFATNGLQTGVTVLRVNDGSGAFTTTEPFPAGIAFKTAFDFDDDGDFDLMGTGPRVYSNLTRQIARGSLARPGRVASLDLYGPVGTPFFLFASPGTAALSVPPFGTVLIDPPTAVQIAAGSFLPSGTSLSAVVPNDPALIGGTLYWQALIASQQRLTNREVTTILGL